MNRLLLKFSIGYFLFILLFLVASQPVLAGLCETTHVNNTSQCVASASDCPSDKQGIDTSRTDLCDTGYKCCYKAAAESGTDLQPESPDNLLLQVPIFDFSSASNMVGYIAKIYEYVLIILIPLAVIMIIVGGIQWIIATGEAGKIKLAQKQIYSAIFGLLLGLFSYIILSLVGLGSLSMPDIEKIEPVIVNNETTGAPCDENNPTEERCKMPSFTSYNDILLHTAYAAGANKVPLVKQTGYADLNYGDCGTIATSGCGIASLTMMLQYWGKSVTVPEIAQMSLEMEGRDCPAILPAGCVNNPTDLTKNCQCCGGTRYNVFLSNPNNELMKKYDIIDTKNYTSSILRKYNLKGELISQIDYKTILTHLSAQQPLIVSMIGPSRFTTGGHFIVLTGCADCIKAVDAKGKLINKEMIINVNDPYNPITTAKVGEFENKMKAVFYIHP